MNERKRGYRRDPVNCQVCGKLIPNAYTSRTYCDDCRKKIRRRYDGKHLRLHKTIREIVIEAEKEGLTYGKYVAKYHL